MITLDFSKIDLIVENACLKLELLKRDLIANERVVVKQRRYLSKPSYDNDFLRDFQSSQLRRLTQSQTMRLEGYAAGAIMGGVCASSFIGCRGQ